MMLLIIKFVKNVITNVKIVLAQLQIALHAMIKKPAIDNMTVLIIDVYVLRTIMKFYQMLIAIVINISIFKINNKSYFNFK
jgi:hypothetical protein